MGKKIWLSMHPRNFGCDVIVRPFMLAEVKFFISSIPLVSAVNHMATQTFRERENHQQQKSRVFLSAKFECLN